MQRECLTRNFCCSYNYCNRKNWRSKSVNTSLLNCAHFLVQKRWKLHLVFPVRNRQLQNLSPYSNSKFLFFIQDLTTSYSPCSHNETFTDNTPSPACDGGKREHMCLVLFLISVPSVVRAQQKSCGYHYYQYIRPNRTNLFQNLCTARTLPLSREKERYRTDPSGLNLYQSVFLNGAQSPSAYHRVPN